MYYISQKKLKKKRVIIVFDRMSFTSYNPSGIITSDFVLVISGPYKGCKGHVISVKPKTIDIHLKFSDNIVITVEKNEVRLRQRMFFRRKDIRNNQDELLANKLKELDIDPSLHERLSYMNI